MKSFTLAIVLLVAIPATVLAIDSSEPCSGFLATRQVKVYADKKAKTVWQSRSGDFTMMFPVFSPPYAGQRDSKYWDIPEIVRSGVKVAPSQTAACAEYGRNVYEDTGLVEFWIESHGARTFDRAWAKPAELIRFPYGRNFERIYGDEAEVRPKVEEAARRMIESLEVASAREQRTADQPAAPATAQ
jgi:hypothetical protein